MLRFNAALQSRIYAYSMLQTPLSPFSSFRRGKSTMPSERVSSAAIDAEVKDLGKQAGPRPMTAEEIKKHPEYPFVNWNLVATKRGRVPVAKGRGGPFELQYEIHGRGPTKVALIMGLGSLKGSWQRQTKDFGHLQSDKYSVLILDNRGMGESDKPAIRYTTTEMAQDVVDVLDYVGWTGERSVHVVGVSMGGMIAQELAVKIPKRLKSVSLVSTGPRIFNTQGFFENIYNRALLFIPRPIDAQLASIKYNMFSDSFLHLPDELEYTKEPYPTNGDRVMAVELHKRGNTESFSRTGFILQAWASWYHHKSQKQLADLAAAVGHERIQVIHGTADRMVTFPHGEELLRGLGGKEAGITVHFVKGQGHVLPIEMRHEFNSWLDNHWKKAETLED